MKLLSLAIWGVAKLEGELMYSMESLRVQPESTTQVVRENLQQTGGRMVYTCLQSVNPTGCLKYRDLYIWSVEAKWGRSCIGLSENVCTGESSEQTRWKKHSQLKYYETLFSWRINKLDGMVILLKEVIILYDWLYRKTRESSKLKKIWEAKTTVPDLKYASYWGWWEVDRDVGRKLGDGRR